MNLDSHAMTVVVNWRFLVGYWIFQTWSAEKNRDVEGRTKEKSSGSLLFAFIEVLV